MAEGGRLPLTLAGARDPLPVVYRTPVPSAQIKSPCCFAGLQLLCVTTVIEAEASRDHTELMLRHSGADVKVSIEGTHGRRIDLTANPN